MDLKQKLVKCIKAQKKIIDAQEKLLVAYRMGSPPPEKVFDILSNKDDVAAMVAGVLQESTEEQPHA